jgi:hypothetical protein
VTPKYRYLVYYMIDDGAEEIVILTIQHPARRREYRDVNFDWARTAEARCLLQALPAIA